MSFYSPWLPSPARISLDIRELLYFLGTGNNSISFWAIIKLRLLMSSHSQLSNLHSFRVTRNGSFSYFCFFSSNVLFPNSELRVVNVRFPMRCLYSFGSASNSLIHQSLGVCGRICSMDIVFASYDGIPLRDSLSLSSMTYKMNLVISLL